jgi:hypothetical protein
VQGEGRIFRGRFDEFAHIVAKEIYTRNSDSLQFADCGFLHLLGVEIANEQIDRPLRNLLTHEGFYSLPRARAPRI